MNTVAEIAAPFVCVAPLFVMFAFERWIAHTEPVPVDDTEGEQ